MWNLTGKTYQSCQAEIHRQRKKEKGEKRVREREVVKKGTKCLLDTTLIRQ
jgi:hypothetical protein